MFRFEITPPKSLPAFAAIDADWDESAEINFSGDTVSITTIKHFVEDHGFSPDGRLIRLPYLEPMSLHYTLHKAGKEGYRYKILEGEPREYPVKADPRIGNTKSNSEEILEPDEPIDSQEDEELAPYFDDNGDEEGDDDRLFCHLLDSGSIEPWNIPESDIILDKSIDFNNPIPPASACDNIFRGVTAAEQVMKSKKSIRYAMYRKELDSKWIAFEYGITGKAPDFDRGGRGLSHIYAKRNWEKKYMSEAPHEGGKDFLYRLVTIIATGTISDGRKGAKVISIHNDSSEGFDTVVIAKARKVGGNRWVLTSYYKHKDYFKWKKKADIKWEKDDKPEAEKFNYYEGAGASGGRVDLLRMAIPSEKVIPFTCATHNKFLLAASENTALSQNGCGTDEIIDKNSDDINQLIVGTYNNKDIDNNDIAFGRTPILDAASRTLTEPIRQASTIDTLKKAFFDVISQIDQNKKQQRVNQYTITNPPFGPLETGKKYRDKINAQCRAIIDNKRDDPSPLTEEERKVLLQYSGQGGTENNSMYEYYTDANVAEGMWEMLAANGFSGGNMLEPCAGPGVFNATKPDAVVMSAVEISDTAASVNRLLHPEDQITTGSFEKVAVVTPDNTWDSVVGNVPFGVGRSWAHEDKDPRYRDETHIEKYFIHRSLDKVKPGGLVALIVPTRVISDTGHWVDFRKSISYKGEFLGGIRLPSKAFYSTTTVTDILLLKKHPESLLNKVYDLPEETLSVTNVLWDTFIKGQWFDKDGKKYITGQYIPKDPNDPYSRHQVVSDLDSSGLKSRLASKFKTRIDWAALEEEEPDVPRYEEGDRRYMGDLPYELVGGQWQLVDIIKETASGIDKQSYGVASLDALKSIIKSPDGLLQITCKQATQALADFPHLFTAQQQNAIRFANAQTAPLKEIALRGSLIGNLLNQVKMRYNRGEEVDVELESLRQMIDAQVDTYGPLHKQKVKISMGGGAAQHYSLFAGSKDKSGNFSDFLQGTLDTSTAKGFDASNPKSIVEHLMQHGPTDRGIMVEDLKALYQGSKTIETLADVAEFDDIAITPAGFLVPMDKYASGAIYEKLDDLTLAIANIEEDKRVKDKWQGQIDLIKKNREWTDINDATITLNQSWLDPQLIVEFFNDNGYEDLEVTEQGRFFGLKSAGFENALTKYLNGERVRGSSKKAEYVAQIEAFEEQFSAFLQQHEDSIAIAEQYNRTFHGYIAPDYSTDPLNIEGIGENITPHGYQNAAIRQLSEEGKGILALNVGLGKTFTALGLAKYNLQMGRAKRTCIVVPASVLANWYHEARTLYQNMNGVLMIGFTPELDKDGNSVKEPVLDEYGEHKKNKRTGKLVYQDKLKEDSREEIHRKMWSIPHSNINTVIMSSSRYGMIPIRPDTLERYADQWIANNLISDRDAAAAAEKIAGVSKSKGKRSYQEAKKLESYNQKYRAEGTTKSDEYPFYEDMGFDSVIVDEAHYFKNVYRGGKEASNIAYLSNPDVSDRAVDMAIKMSHLRDSHEGRGPVLLSATPITNSPLEVFNALSLIIPMEEFERMGVRTPDDFVRKYARTRMIDRETVSGEMKTVEALMGFQNLKQLRSLFFKYTNMKSASDVGESLLVLPESVENNEVVETTSEQYRLYTELQEEAEKAGGWNNNTQDEETGEQTRALFSVIRDMEIMATDIDMYYKRMTWLFPTRYREQVEAMAQSLPDTVTAKRYDETVNKQISLKVKKSYTISQASRSVQLQIQQEYESAIEKALKKLKIPWKDMTHPVPPKYAKLLENVKKHLKTGKQLIFTQEKTQHRKIRRIISSKLKVEPDKIGIINADEASGEKLQQLSDAYNRGDKLIMVCNEKAEVGVNLQRGTTAVHHLTLPWTPTSLQQANGRAVRQGNTAKRIDIYYYLAEDSFDDRRLDILKSKADWLNELMRGEDSDAEAPDMMGDEDLKLMLSKDPEAEKAARQKRLEQAQAARDLRARKFINNQMAAYSAVTNHLNEYEERSEKELHKLQSEIDNLNKTIELSKAELAKDLGDDIRRITEGRIVRAENKLALLSEDLEAFETRSQVRRKKLDNKKKQLKIFLESKAKSGELPFDKALLDNPAGILTNKTGALLIAKGLYFQLPAEDGVQSLVEIDETNQQAKTVTVKKLSTLSRFRFEKLMEACGVPEKEYGSGNRKPTAGYSWMGRGGFDFYTFPVVFFPDQWTPAQISQEDISAIQFTGLSFSYGELARGEVDKLLWQGHATEQSIHHRTYCLIRSEGKLSFEKFNRYSSKIGNLVWPDREDLSLKEEVIKYYLEFIKSCNNSTKRDFDGILLDWFGSDWQADISNYGNKANQSDVVALVTDIINQAIDKEFRHEKRDAEGIDKIANQLITITYERSVGWLMTAKAQAVTESKKLGDNLDDIKRWRNEVYGSIKQQYQDKANRLQEEKKKAEARNQLRVQIIENQIANIIYDTLETLAQDEQYSNAVLESIISSARQIQSLIKTKEQAGDLWGNESLETKLRFEISRNIIIEGHLDEEIQLACADAIIEGLKPASETVLLSKPTDDVSLYASHGLTLRINEKDLEWTGYGRNKKKYNNTVAKETCFFISDGHREKTGSLYKAMTSLYKLRKEFKGKFGEDPDPTMPGCWWFFPLSLISPSQLIEHISPLL